MKFGRMRAAQEERDRAAASAAGAPTTRGRDDRVAPLPAWLGEFKIGRRIPSETRLIEQFGIGRSNFAQRQSGFSSTKDCWSCAREQERTCDPSRIGSCCGAAFGRLGFWKYWRSG